jgi:hypothetical protein
MALKTSLGTFSSSANPVEVEGDEHCLWEVDLGFGIRLG